MHTTATAPTPHLSVGKALHSIHRLEVGPMYFFVLVWGMFVAADRVSDLWQPAAILAFLINGLSLFSGFVINSYSDYPIDIRSPIKNHVAHGVDALGHRRVLILYFVEQAVTLVMAAVISQMLDNWVFVVVKFVGVASGYVYNAEPIRLKRHGLWNPLMMGIRFGFVPGLIAYLAVHHGVIAAGGWLLLVGMTVISISRGFWNTISDVDEDAAERIRTPSVVYGALASMRVAWLLLVPSLVCSVWGLVLLFGPWGAAGAAGMLGALVYRAMLLIRVHDDRSAIDLMRSPGIRKVDGRWSKWTYYTVAAAGIAHFVF